MAQSDPAAIETCDVAFEATDYLPEKATVRWLPGESLVTHDVRLRTVASAGGRVPVTIEVVDASGQPVDAPFFVEIRTPTESPTVLTSASMTRSAAGRYTSELPPGEADLRVVLPQHFYWAYSWHGRVLVEPGRDLVVKAQVPSGAPLTVQWSPPSAPEQFPGLLFRKAGDATWSSEGLAPTGEGTGTKLRPVARGHLGVRSRGGRDRARAGLRDGHGHARRRAARDPRARSGRRGSPRRYPPPLVRVNDFTNVSNTAFADASFAASSATRRRNVSLPRLTTAT